MDAREKLKAMITEIEALIVIMKDAGISARELIAALHKLQGELYNEP